MEDFYNAMELDNNTSDEDNEFDLGIEIQDDTQLAEQACLIEFAADVNNVEIPIPPLDNPPPLPHYMLRKNPPVMIEIWPDPPPNDPDSDLDEELEQDLATANQDYDPKYIEQDEPPRVDPDDEPRLTDEEMQELIEMDFW
ncbi:hypothetical protein RHS01_10412 [Rhizoctonia solani]|uniref:Uncharacterized protein n=1 Tax=Rhizoctonia solani TaxID=456999 RepID=A0A8H7I1T7_9AGAM|nr:hypothetical protein RHS01_10412 [Rhizoctonia solani]